MAMPDIIATIRVAVLLGYGKIMFQDSPDTFAYIDIACDTMGEIFYRLYEHIGIRFQFQVAKTIYRQAP